MAWKPSAKIYASNGITLVYTIETIIQISGWPKEEPSYVEKTNLRSAGSIVIPGGNKPYDIRIYGRLSADNYNDLTTAMFALKNTILTHTNYVLKLDKSDSTTDNLNVQRLSEIIWDESKGNRTKYAYYYLTLRVNTWR